jgi:hypothetical protein
MSEEHPTLEYTESKLRPHLANGIHKCPCNDCDERMLVLVDKDNLLSKQRQHWQVDYNVYVKVFHELKTFMCPHRRFPKVWDWLKGDDLNWAFENRAKNEITKKHWDCCEEAICEFFICRMVLFGTRVPMLAA